ncbi:MAG: glycosyltransferase family 4 protein [Clostridiaceae bacterium]|nr:glycosyltransferase family 4 protein [Clostridiaceae bacterium]
MNILLFMSSGLDTPGPSLHLYTALIEDLVSYGHNVHLIESHSTGINPDCPERLANLENFTYETINIEVVAKNAFVKRYLVGVKYCFKARKVFKEQQGFDVMMIQSCPWAPFAVTFAKNYVKVPVIYNSQDMFPGASIANGVMKQKWMQKFFYAFQKIAYKKADHISVISEDMKQKVIEQGVVSEKITIIPNWYDDKSVKEIPWDENLFIKKYGMKKDIFYVQYAGTMGFNFDFQMVIDVAEILKNEKNVVFQMIGSGSQKDVFEKTAKERGLYNIVFLPFEPQEMVSHVYSACSVCLIPLPKGVIGNSVPSKAGLLMACNRVIITSADPGSEYNKMFEREQIGIAYSTDDSRGVAAGILKLRDNPDLRERYADNAQKYGKAVYARTINTGLYEDLYRRIGEKA